MALTPLNWRYVGTATLSAVTVPAMLDAIYTLGTATTYANGSARTPGSGSAWTWLRQQIAGTTEAVYGNPPTNALAMRYIIGGTTATVRAYPILSPDTATQVNTIVYGMNRGSGAFGNWYDAQPFTSGFSGYWRGTRAFATVLYDRVAMWESQEGCIIQPFVAATSANTSIMIFGAIIDPLSTTAGTCESDGRIYAMSGSGSATNLSATWAAIGAADGGLLGHYSVQGTSHFGAFNNGATTVTGLIRTLGPQTSTSFPAGWANRAGEIPRIPVQVSVFNSTYWGQLREMYHTTDASSTTTWRYLGVEQGYIVAYHPSGAADALFLKV
jgi:hypothetical protein